MDFGMERCSLAIRLPSRGDALPYPYSFKDVADTVCLDVCELDAKRPLDERTLTWNNRPACIRNLGILDAKVGGEAQMEPFPCKSGTFLAYEISCAPETPDCGIEIWSNQNETWGQSLFPDLRGAETLIPCRSIPLPVSNNLNDYRLLFTFHHQLRKTESQLS